MEETILLSPHSFARKGNLDIRKYESTINSAVLKEIEELGKRCDIREPFDTSCDIVYTWVIDDCIVGVAAFKKYLFNEQTQEVVPRFEHIFGLPEVQKTMRGVKFLLSCISDLKDMGFKKIWCYIMPDKKYMEVYADKLGFKCYAEDPTGKFYLKEL